MARLDIDAYSSTVGAFYDAAYGAADWPNALSKLNDLMDGSRSWLFHCEPGHLNAHMSVYDEGFHSAEGQAAAMRDPLFDLYRTRQPGTIVRHSELEDVSDFRKRELWQDWLRVLSLPIDPNSPGDGASMMPIQCAADRNTCDPGGRME